MKERSRFEKHQARVDNRARVFGTVLLVLFSTFVLGCGPKKVWSERKTSPSGKWIASSRTEVWSGPGVGTVESSVSISRADKPSESVDIVSYPEGTADARAQVIWNSDKELLIRVPNPAVVDLQMIKFADVRIYVEQLQVEAQPSGALKSTEH
jgi:hypothetical protein